MTQLYIEDMQYFTDRLYELARDPHPSVQQFCHAMFSLPRVYTEILTKIDEMDREAFEAFQKELRLVNLKSSLEVYDKYANKH